jgi:hypothetical protein
MDLKLIVLLVVQIILHTPIANHVNPHLAQNAQYAQYAQYAQNAQYYHPPLFPQATSGTKEKTG